jgi:hypothetical protein
MVFLLMTRRQTIPRLENLTSSGQRSKLLPILHQAKCLRLRFAWERTLLSTAGFRRATMSLLKSGRSLHIFAVGKELLIWIGEQVHELKKVFLFGRFHRRGKDILRLWRS